jgi:predicted SAM-dependent methyltransferase
MGSLKKYVKSHTTLALRRAIRELTTEVSICFRHWDGVRKAPQLVRTLPLKLNLGCGPNYKQGWVNIDLFASSVDLQIDLRRRWPFPDSSAMHIYSEHALEHFEFAEEVPHFISESLRVLQRAGTFDVGVPDTEWAVRAYGDRNHDYWRHTARWHPDDCKTQMDHINFHFRQGKRHKYAWDEETLKGLLQRSGFEFVTRRPFDATLDTESRRVGTLYMRAIKPSTSNLA